MRVRLIECDPHGDLPATRRTPADTRVTQQAAGATGATS